MRLEHLVLCVLLVLAISSAAHAERTTIVNILTYDGDVKNKQAASNDVNSATYEKSKFCIATIEGFDGSGTGFLCEMDGKKYFVTNKHVADQRGRISASFIDGTTLTFRIDSPIDVAVNRDLVRFEVSVDKPFLSIFPGTPRIGEQIEFYGNALGHKVITMTAGKILAVGMERIEIDSQIQGGNSGSPLVLAADGRVIGVTTISEFNRLGNDPSKVGTRYDPSVKLTREFAVRFQGVEWKSTTYGKFLNSVNTYKDYCNLYEAMHAICLSTDTLLESELPDLQFSVSSLNAIMKKIAKCDDAYKKSRDRLAMMSERLQNQTSRIGGYSQFDVEREMKKIKDRLVASYKVRKEALASIVARAKIDTSLSKERKEVVVDAFGRMHRRYCEKFRRQLQGYDLGLPDGGERPSRPHTRTIKFNFN